MKALQNRDGTHAAEIQSALDWLIEQSTDLCEHGVILDGSTLATKKLIHGTNKSVVISIFDIRPGDILLHNHPCLNSLSNLDLYAAADLELRAVYAVTADESVYRASHFTMSDRRLFWKWENAASRLDRPVMRELRSAGIPIDLESDGVYRINSAHWLNRELARQGLFNYDYWLKGQTIDIINRLPESL